MVKQPSNRGKSWTPAQNRELRQLAKGNTPTRVTGLKLSRTADAARGEAHKLGVSLKPTNQSPYNRRKP